MNCLVRTELLKQRTTRTFVVIVTAAPVVAGLVTFAILGAAGRQGNDPLGPDSLRQAIGSPSGAITLLAILLGLLGTAGEYRHQTITTTFLSTPRREHVVLAKLAASSLVGAALGCLSITVSAALAVPWLLSSGVAVDVDAGLLRVVGGVVLSTTLYGALGVSVGALVRNQTAAAAVVLVWILALEGLVTDVFTRSDFVHWLPAAAGRALVNATNDALPTPVAAAAFLAYVAAFSAAAAGLTLHRDVT